MKRILYLFLVLPYFIFSCESSPEAYFSTNTIEPEIGQEVFFYNDSRNATDFEWDFGDGFISNEKSPRHIYNVTGTYEIILKAFSKGGLESRATLTLTVLIPTLLEIEVREYYFDYTVSDASVILYPSLADWDAQTNKVYEGFTDSYGIVVFAGLKNIQYFVDVWEQDHNNYKLKDLDVGFIRTPEVIPHKINRFIAWVKYDRYTKGTAKRTSQMVLNKLERKVPDKHQPEADMRSQDWQELYNRRAIQK
jgi:hypothetical protein